MLRLRKKEKAKGVDRKHVETMLRDELAGYVSREELREVLEKITKDKNRASLWDSLPLRKKIRVLRYVIKQERGEHGKKKKNKAQ